ncbi:pyridoxal phosphate-dependent aminotransferase [Tsukamurella ocularis]|uniref:pyridoxal phosphate-dependent aminotransferase n=1 Tax=Tsukamurella ocularis TaxID=1970234 RepID=UPI0021684B4D|nr:pyridoxal phosphate-dependent aminotransferase [Tsukamurella ocularis]MCS3781850.1 aspartate/methionine/tyrosine aminotransferase [Tsukamurella ocularis]MCS3788344.1 aspartate/methionine/tyrosine aminotransferase [Tsukamurella ocularis]MCS3852064.1 aspartate/methionine/tyrosine aminotransferase [Tsukamurella ocularis]
MDGMQEARRSDVEMFHVMDVLAAAARRRETHGDVISLAAGQPSAGAPKPVLAAAHAALDGGPLGYTESLGIAPLRETIAAHYGRAYGLDVPSEAVAVTTGSSGAFTLVFLAAFDVGDTVVMARPGYPAYRNTLKALGCEVVELDCGAATRYQPTVAMLEALDRPPKGLIVASPANPTGTILAPSELAGLARWCEANGTLLISDEIYHGVSYGRPTSCAWETSREQVVMGSVSKYFAMTGWRLGWMLLPEYLRRPVERLTANMTICPPAISQYAAVAAFSDEARAELDAHVAGYARNREIVLAGLRELGVTEVAPPDGAFYAYADIGHLTDDSLAWCARVLDETGVAITPGLDFDTARGRRTIRISFAGATAEIEEALHRLRPVFQH